MNAPRFRLPRLLSCLAFAAAGWGLGSTSLAAAEANLDRAADIYRPFRTERAAVSPDGRYVAYSVRDGERLFVSVVEVEHPEKKSVGLVLVADDESSTPMLSDQQREKTPAQILWLGWATSERVVVETNRVFTQRFDTDGGWRFWTGAVLGFNFDGSDFRLLAQPSDLPENITDFSGENLFSVQRDRTAKIANTWDVSMPTASANTSNALGFVSIAGAPGTPTAIPTDPNGAVISSTTSTTTASLPRIIHVVDRDLEHPGAVRLSVAGSARDTGSRRLAFYSLNASSGKLTHLTDDAALNTNDVLLDRQGRIRLTLSNTQLSSFPLHYMFRGRHLFDRDQPLDRATGLTEFSVEPANFFGVRGIPLGFDVNADVLYFASNLDRDTYGVYSLNLTTHQRGAVTLEDPTFDLVSAPGSGFSAGNSLIYDPYMHQLAGIRFQGAVRSTAWLRPELRGVQSYLEKRFAGQNVELLDWDQRAERFVVRTSAPADAGALYAFDAPAGRLLEISRRAPWLGATQIHPTIPFNYAADSGFRISGLVTVPNQPRLKPYPLIILCPTQPWDRASPDYSTTVQALADLGLVVVQLDGRGVWGLGLKHRQALTSGYDVAQVEDIAGSLAHLDKMFHVNLERVALLGFGHGGFIALRTLQAHPELFRCAIAIETPVNLKTWLSEQKWSGEDVQSALTRAWLGDDARLKAAPLESHPESRKKPSLLMNCPGPDGAPRTANYLAARYFAQAVRGQGVIAQFTDLPTDYTRGLPQAQASVFATIADFLNVHIYDYKVKMGELQVKPDGASKP